MDNLIGRRLDGRYEILELIGVGGMANVYKAHDLSTGNLVAVKVLREEFLDNEELVRRFKNESKAIALLSHPNIVKVFDVNFSDKVQYIVMEFIDGITLKQYIDVQKPLSWKDTVHFTTQILRALQHAHDRGIVHRDIKPQNIMLLADGSIKVMDFGIARFSRSETRTITDKAIGSVHYISPEQAKGDITDAKADIYSVGIMMYEMLTGTLPFESDTPVQVALKQISDDARRPREIVSEIPEGLEEITLKAMAKDPAKRYQSASQMLRDIDDFKKNPSIVFEYKYFTDPDPTRYMDSAAATGAAKGKGGKTKGKKTADKSSKSGGKRKPGTISRASITMYTVLGVTAAIVICTLILSLFSLGFFDGNHEETVMPNFIGQESDSVTSSATYNFRYKISEDSDYNAQYPAGTIYRQNPMPGMPVKDNARVELYVSKGTRTVVLPNVVEMESGDAVEYLRDLGVQVRWVSVSDYNYASNLVLKMDPVATTEVEAGSLVTLTINILPTSSTFVVPDVRGMEQYNGYTELYVNGLSVGAVTQIPHDSPAGTIIDQSIDPGTRVNAGTKIDLVISSGAPTIKYTIAAPMPSPLNGNPYTVTVSVNGSVVYTNAFSAADPGWSIGVTVNSVSTIVISINGLEYQTYTASNVTNEITMVSGTPSWSWPTHNLNVTVEIIGNGAVPGLPTTVQYGGSVNINPVAGDPGATVTITVNGASISAGPYSNITSDIHVVVTFTAP